MHGFTNKDKIDTLETARKVLETIEEAKRCEMDSGPKGVKKIKGFDKKDMLKKAEKDAVFFEHLFDSVIGSDSEAARTAYEKLVTEAMVLTGQILQEADIAPKTISPIVDHQILSEDEMVEYYKRSFNLILEHKFNKPNIKSDLLFEDIVAPGQGNCQAQRILAPGIKGLMIKCAKTGILDQNDPEAVAKYLSAENAVSDAISNTLIPDRIMQQISSFQDNKPAGYEAIFGNSIGDKIQAFRSVVAKLAAIIAPFIFANALSNANLQVAFNPVQVAGLGLDLDSSGNDALDSSGNDALDSSGNDALDSSGNDALDSSGNDAL